MTGASNRQQKNSASPALRCIVGWIDCKLFPRGDDRCRLARKSHPRRRMSDAGSFRESQLYFSFHGIDIVVVSHGEAKLLANTLHRLVFTKDLSENVFHSFLPANFE